MRTVVLVGAAIAAALAGSASAAVRYEFTAHSSFDGVTGDFSVTLPDFAFGDVEAVPQSCSSSAGCGTTQRFLDDDAILNGGSDHLDVVGFRTGASQQIFYYFADGAFSQFGTFGTVLFDGLQAGTLVVSQVDDTGAVPEPATWAIMIGGFGLAGASLRRRRAVPA